MRKLRRRAKKSKHSIVKMESNSADCLSYSLSRSAMGATDPAPKYKSSSSGSLKAEAIIFPHRVCGVPIFLDQGSIASGDAPLVPYECFLTVLQYQI